MAFNPFRKFRKHQKVFMAALVFVSMISFIMISGSSLGGGDALGSITRWFTGGAAKTDVAKLYGKEISAKELQQVYVDRIAANEFMARATRSAFDKRIEELRKTLPAGPQAQQQIFNLMFSDPECLSYQQRMRGGLYFGGDLSTQGLLDHLIWKRQAEKLGISLTEKEVNEEFLRLTGKRVKPKDTGLIEQELRQVPQLKALWTQDLLINALKDEFAVRLAQNALLGYETGSIDRVPAPITPAEFWNFYKDQRTTVEVGLLPVNVQDFVSQVKEEPTPQEIKDLYNKYRDEEYKPEKPEPGFKQPRRAQIEWVSARWDSPIFKQMAKDELVASEAAQELTGALPGNPLMRATAVALPATVDLRLVSEYESALLTRKYRLASFTQLWGVTWGFAPYPVHERSLKQPVNLASAVGLGIGTPGLATSPLAAVAALELNTVRKETLDRATVGTTFMLAGAGGVPYTPAAMMCAVSPKERDLPFKSVKDQILDRLSSDKVLEARSALLDRIKKEVEELAKKDPKEVDRYLNGANWLFFPEEGVVKKYGLQYGKTTDLRDEFKNKLIDDPGLKPLKEAYLSPPSLDPSGNKFASKFMSEGTKTYAPQSYPEGLTDWRTKPESFVWWKTEEDKAKMLPLDNPQVKAEVIAAWKFRKARELAKKEAERLAEEVKKEKGDRRLLKDFAARQKKSLIELMPIAKQNRRPALSPDEPPSYDGPKVPSEKVPHAGGEEDMFGRARGASGFADKLVGLRDKPVGDTVVVADQPEATYYVAALIEKKAPSEAEFTSVYRETASGSKRQDPLFQQFYNEQAAKYYKECMDRLREDAKLVIHDSGKKMFDNRGED